MALSHAQFWRLTQYELYELLRGQQSREDTAWFRSAWEVCHIAAPNMRRPYQIDTLLAFRQQLRGKARFSSKAEAQREYRQLVQEMTGKRAT